MKENNKAKGTDTYKVKHVINKNLFTFFIIRLLFKIIFQN